MQFVRYTFHTGLIIFCLTLSSIASAERGILWQIDNGHSQPSFLLGTVHSDDPRITNLPESIKTIFNQASSFSAELNMDAPNLIQAQSLMLLSDGRKLVDMIGQTRYQQCVHLMAARGMPEMLVQQMKPWAIAAQLTLPKLENGLFLDMLLYQEASSAGKPVYGLETIQEQMHVFDALTEKQQIMFLDDAIKHVGEVPEMIRTITRLYLARDLAGLKDYSDNLMAQSPSSLMVAFKKRLVVDRNQRMVERMQPRLIEGNAFIAVGALHLPGEKGIIRLLEQRGNRVKAVY